MDEVSIIINGVRYDAVVTKYADDACSECDLKEFCNKTDFHNYSCYAMIGNNRHFTKSTKDFER
jgi:hypothetical protein